MKDKFGSYLTDHPKTITLLTTSLVIFSGWNLYRAVKLHVYGQQVVGNIQRNISEQLGG